ncbi:hypothetical protein ASD79_01125 [Caulobacter sp. Root655]|uniref:hypothetical protein n=1 Tax=Caulobacter sp. Root655 TaxID=1736578 RepID=UPI0007144670|nr:hypothetical protein [Caulobacter sp. Root655]KRA65916.1 hypothetical protein ASD79_01125 [Caulobacter sp. Root655]
MSRNRGIMACAHAAPLFAAPFFAIMGAASPVAASTPVLAWDGARLVGVHCLVDPDRLANRRKLQASLCERVRTLAAEKAPLPVAVLPPGDPRLIASDTVVLLFHAAVQTSGGGEPLLVFTTRSFRPTAAPSELFGAAPRAVPLPAGGASPRLDTALDAALDETLPWRSRAPP